MDNSIQKTTLYRYFDSEGRLLYVGITGNQFNRLDQHSKTQPWWLEVHTGSFQHFQTRQEALDAEAYAIGSELPKYNKAGPVLDQISREHLADLIAGSLDDDFHNRVQQDMAARMYEVNQFSKKPEPYKLLFAFGEAMPWDEEGEEMLIDCLKCQKVVDSKWYRTLYAEVQGAICDEFVA